MLEFRLLGPLEVARDGHPLALPAGKQRALLADLVLHGGRAVPVERLVDDLWGEEVPEHAVKALQVYVSKLRKLLPEGRLRTVGSAYLLDTDGDEVDLDRFSAQAREGGEALEAGDAETAASLLAEALALWRGPALAELDEPFARAESARLEELRLACLEERIEAELALGRHATLVGELEALTARHPLRERPREQLILALYRSGRQAEALAAYQSFRRSLDDDLGIEPSPRLRALEGRILRQDETLAPPPPPTATERPQARRAIRPATPAPPRPPRMAPVGRTRELAHLEEQRAAAAAGERRVVFVTGEAGAGKTTLVEAFLAAVEEGGGWLVGRGQCVEHHGAGEPYLPVLEALARLCRDHPAAGLVDVLRERAPTWLVQLPWLLDPAELEALQPRALGANRERMQREMTEALEALSARAPVAILLEDVHWSDLSTLDLVDAVARRYEPARLLLVSTFRGAEAGRGESPLRLLAQALRARGLGSELALGLLDEEAVRTYLTTRLGEGPVDELTAVLHERTRGNPLFVEKLVDAWLERGAITVQAAGTWELAERREALSGDVPESLRLFIERRLADLDDDEQAVLTAASAAGAEFSAALVAAAVAQDADPVERRLAKLAADGTFVEARGEESWPDGTVSSRFGFVHDVCQEVFLETLPPGVRTSLHRRLGERLEAAYGERAREIASTLAWHAVEGRDDVRAARHLVAAATQAFDRSGPREALGHLLQALDVLDALAGEERGRAELPVQLLLGRALIETEGWSSAGAEEALVRARELAVERGDPEELARTVHRLATLYEIRGEYERSEALLAEVLRLPSASATAEALVDANELMACSLFHQGHFDRALHHADDALSHYDGAYVNRFAAVFGENPGVACQGWGALASWFLGRPDEAVDRAAKAVAASTRGTRLHARAMAQAQAAVVAQLRDEPEEALAWAEAAIEAASTRGFAYWLAMATVVRGWSRARLGEVDEGLAEIRRAIELSRRLGARMDDAYYHALLAEAAARAGRTEEGLAAVDEALTAVAGGRSFFFVPELHRVRAELLVAAGDDDGAARSLEQGLTQARLLGSPSLELRSALALARLRPEDPSAAASVTDALERMTEDGASDAEAARTLLRERGLDPSPRAPAERHAAEPSGPGHSPVRYAQSEGLAIAYQLTRGGPLDIVLVPGFVSHLEQDWDDPRHARFLERLASPGRLIRFDKRGTGLSDRPPGLPDLETRMDDLRAVMDAAGCAQAVLFGYSEGGPLSVLFAATFPERVRALVLFGAFAKRIDPDADYPWAPTAEERAAHTEELASEWGLESNLKAMCPSADDAMARWWRARCRAAASPGAVRALVAMNSRIDVRDVLGSIRVPTLVLHRRGDTTVHPAEGRYIASHIAGARFVELPGDDHFVAVDPDQILDAALPFIREHGEGPPSEIAPDRVLATVLVAGVESTTPNAASLGEQAWAQQLDRFQAQARAQIDRFAGEPAHVTGSELTATFDGPARALRCGRELIAAGAADRLAVRVGVHTGEVERRPTDLHGLAVEVAARLARTAEPGEVLTSSTTRDLVAGSGLDFDDRGEQRLPGLEGPRAVSVLLS